jgi:predicted kinase
MATLHLIVGLPCSGKTTLARQLETGFGALRVTTDEWHIRLFGQDYGAHMTESEEALHDSRHESVESIMWDVAARVLVLGGCHSGFRMLGQESARRVSLASERARGGLSHPFQ